MMIRAAMFLVAAGGLLTSCATPPPLPSGNCDATKVQSAVGQPFTVERVAQMETDSEARTSRVIRPDQAVTMDFRSDRLNIELDANDRITSVKCG